MVDSRLSSSLSALAVPPDFSRLDDLTDSETLSRLEQWKLNASRVLSELRDLLQGKTELSLDEQADIVSGVAPHAGDGIWVTQGALHISNDILERWKEPDVQVLRHILQRNVKPLFSANPHPHINLDTGRKLPRPAGGPSATSDFYEDQVWKDNPGSVYMVQFVVRHLKSDDYEALWLLLIPPLMTLLDDYQARNKLHGVKIARMMLERLPKSLLKRTGLDALLSQSLVSCLGQIHSPESPDLLREAIPVWLTLALMTTEEGSPERFNALCTLLGDNIIGAVWFYGYNSANVVLATIEVLPPVLKAMGIGSVRFLKGLMHQLLQPLVSSESNDDMQISSLSALLVLMEECAPRLAYWKGKILAAVAKSWVLLKEGKAANEELQKLLQDVCKRLAETCPSVVEAEYEKLLALDMNMFRGLLGSEPE